MEFLFSEDQRMLQKTVRDFLEGECPVEAVRARWETESGRSLEFWKKLAEIGVPGLLVPEAHGGLGMDELDLVLVLEECGRAALPEPVIATAAVAVPLLCELGDSELREAWLPRIAAGDAIVAVGAGSSISPFVADAHVADLLLLPDGGAIHAVDPAAVSLTAQPANDPSQKLFTVDWTPGPGTRVGTADDAASIDRGALACAAQQLGVGDRLIEMSVAYATQRKQFGVPIGSFQAVKHQLANCAVKVEYARSLVYRAAHSVARAMRCQSVDVSMAKLQASQAAVFAAKTALQVHGAIGYTWEQDLHVWMRRAWSLERAWGCSSWHRRRIADAVIDGALPAESFGYSAPGGERRRPPA